MFGRHPRLAVDAWLGLNSPDKPVSSRAQYATKLKKRPDFIYKLADRWVSDLYVVIGIPMYNVEKEFGDGSVKTLQGTCYCLSPLFLAYLK